MQTDHKFMSRKVEIWCQTQPDFKSPRRDPLLAIVEERRKQLFLEAHSKMLKQECRAEKAEAIFVDFNDNIQSNRMGLAEPARTHEENEYN